MINIKELNIEISEMHIESKNWVTKWSWENKAQHWFGAENGISPNHQTMKFEGVYLKLSPDVRIPF